MPNDAPVWDETVAVPTWDETHAPKAPTSYPMGGTFAPTPEQMAAAKETIRKGDVKYDESFVNIPPLSGEEITATTGLQKAITIPAAAAANLPIGIVNYFGSPQGVTEAAAALTPAAPLVGLKWAKDMIVGAGEAAKDLAERTMYNRLKQAVGAPVTEPVTAQELANAAVAVPAMLVGGTGAGLGSARAIRKTLPARPIVPPRVNRPVGLPAEEGAPVLPGGMPPPEPAAIPKPLEIVRPAGPTAAELMAQEKAAQPQFVKPEDYVEPVTETITPPPGVVVTPRVEAKPQPKQIDRLYNQEHGDIVRLRMSLDEANKYDPQSAAAIRTELDDAIQRMGEFDKLHKRTPDVSVLDSPEIATAKAIRQNPRMTYDEAVLEGQRLRRQNVEDLIHDEEPVPEFAKKEFPDLFQPKDVTSIEEAKKEVSVAKPWTGSISFETFDEPTGQWQPQNRPIVVSKSTIPGDKAWRATVFAGPEDSPVAIGHVQMDTPEITNQAMVDLSEQLGRYTRNLKVTPGQGVGPRTQTTPAAAPTSLPATTPAPVSQKPQPLKPEETLLDNLFQKHSKAQPEHASKGFVSVSGADFRKAVTRANKTLQGKAEPTVSQTIINRWDSEKFGVTIEKIGDAEIVTIFKRQPSSVSTPAPSPVEPPPAPAQTPAGVVKQPWEMTLDAWKKWADPSVSVTPQFHRVEVEQALREGKPVPAEVLADYPELKAAAPPPEPPSTPQGPGGAALSETTARQYVLNKIRTDDPEFVGSTLYSKHIGTTKDGKNVVNVFLLDGIGGPIKSQEHVLVSQDGKVVVSPEAKPPAEPPAKAVSQTPDAKVEIRNLRIELTKLQNKLDREVGKMGSMRPPSITAELTRTISEKMAKIQDKIDALERNEKATGRIPISELPDTDILKLAVAARVGKPSEYFSNFQEAKSIRVRLQDLDDRGLLDRSVLGEPPATPPAKAVEKVKEQVATVAKTEGQPSAKAVKTELVRRLEEAAAKAISENDLTLAQRDALANAKSTDFAGLGNFQYGKQGDRLKAQARAAEEKKRTDAAIAAGLNQITFSIPGDGDFTIWNTKETITKVLDAARSLKTSPSEKIPLSKPRMDAAQYLKKDIEDALAVYGNEGNAYRKLSEQLNRASELELDSAQETRLRKLVNTLEENIQAPWKKTHERMMRVWGERDKEVGKGVQQNTQRLAELNKSLSELRALEESQSAEMLQKLGREQPTPQPVSMGGLNPNDPLERPSQMMPTANKNASIDADRIARGEQPMMQAMRRTDPELWDAAMAEINKDWGAADNIIADLKQNPRVPSDLELMILLHRRVDLNNEFAKASRDMALATEEGRTADAQASKAQRDMFLEKLTDLESMLGRGDYAAGTMAGRALRARRLMMNDDFSLASLIVDRQASLGRKLTATETAELEKIAADYKAKADKLDARVAELERQAEEVQAQRIAEQAKRDAEQVKIHPSVLEYAEKFVSAMERKADRYAKDLMGATWSPTPETLGKAAYIGAARLARGIVEMAKWTDEMVAVLGEKFRPYADEVRKKSEELLKAELTEVEKIPNAPKIREVIITGKVEKASPEAIIKRLSERVKKAPKEMPDLQPMARKLAAYFYTQGIHEPMKIVDAVHAEFQRVFPNLERRETMDALSGYGRFSPLSKDALKVALRDVYGQLQQIGKLEDMAKGQAPLKTGPERRVPTDAERALIKQVEEAKKKGGYSVTDPATQLRTALQAAQRRMENQIADLTKEIDTRQKIVKTKTKLVYDAKLTALKAKLDQLREIHREVFKAAPLTEAQRLALWKERITERIADLKERYYMADFKPKPKPPEIRLDKEAIALRYELHKIHRAIMDMRLKDELKKRGMAKKMWDGVTNAIRFSRAVMTGGEFSGVLRQGGFTAASHPILAAKALPDMFRALLNEKNQFAVMDDIFTRDNAPLYKRSKLDFTESGQRLSNMEEHYMFRVAEVLKRVDPNAPLWKRVVQHITSKTVRFIDAFQRAYTTYLNKIRADLFDKLVDTYGDDPVMTKQIANLINVSTGRGSTGLGQRLGEVSNTVFFAPRYTLSRFQLLLGQPAWRGDMATRKMVLKEYGRALSGAAVVYTLGMMAGYTIETDPRSADFGKLKKGNSRIDPLAGLAQATRLVATEATGWRKTQAGKLVPTRETKLFFPSGKGNEKVPYGQPGGWEVLSDYGRTKLSPAVGAGVSYWIVGSAPGTPDVPFKLKDVLIQSSMPITWGDVLKAMKEQGIPEGLAMSVLAIFGMGLQTYEPRQPKSKSSFSLKLGGL